MEKCNALIGMNALVRGFRKYFLVDDARAIQAQLREMDAAIEMLASRQLMADRSIELAWAVREKFLPEALAGLRNSATEAKTSLLAGAYPADRIRATGDELANDQFSPEPALPNTAPPAVVAPLKQNRADPDREPTNPDVLIVDGRLHVMTSGCYVTVNGDDVVVRRRKILTFGMAIREMTMRLGDHGIPVVFTPLVGIPAAIAQPIQSNRSNVRQQ